MLYDYVDNAAELSSSAASEVLGISPEEASSVTDVIRLALSRGGIISEDLSPKQVMVNGSRQLFLMDTEAYTAMRPDEMVQH